MNRDSLAKFNTRKNVLFALAEFSLNSALIFLGYKLLINSGGIEIVGVWATLYAWMNVIKIGDVGVSAAVTRFIAMMDLKTESKTIRIYIETSAVSAIVVFLALSILAYTIISINLSKIVSAAYIDIAQDVLPVIVVGFLFSNLSATLFGALQGLHFGYKRSVITISGAVLQIILVVVLVPRLGLLGFAYAQVSQGISTYLLAWWFLRRSTGLSFVPLMFSKKIFLEMFGYSMGTQWITLANGLFEPLTKMLIGNFGGMASQGLFELAYKSVITPKNLVASGIFALGATMTALSGKDISAVELIYKKALRYSAFAMGGLCLLLICVSPWISYFWLGRIESMYVVYVSILSCGFFFSVMGAPAFMFGMSTGKIRLNIVVACASLFGLFFGGMALGNVFNATGVVVAWLLVNAAAAIVLMIKGNPSRLGVQL